MRSSIFVSGVTSEFGELRRKTVIALNDLNYRAEHQDGFDTDPDELLKILRSKIKSCIGLVQIVGDGFGAQLPQPHPKYGVISYTQYELLCAIELKKKIWLICPQDGCTRDTPPGLLDLPSDPEHPDPIAFQAERSEFQARYVDFLKEKGFRRVKVGSDDAFLLAIEKLRGEYAIERRKHEKSKLLLWCSMFLLALTLAGSISWGVSTFSGINDLLEGRAREESEASQRREEDNALKEIAGSYEKGLQIDSLYQDYIKVLDPRGKKLISSALGKGSEGKAELARLARSLKASSLSRESKNRVFMCMAGLSFGSIMDFQASLEYLREAETLNVPPINGYSYDELNYEIQLHGIGPAARKAGEVGQLGKALAAFDEARDRAAKLVATGKETARCERLLMQAVFQGADVVMRDLNDTKEARARFSQFIDLVEKTESESSESFWKPRNQVRGYMRMSDLEKRENRWNEAIAWYDRCLEVLDPLKGKFPRDVALVRLGIWSETGPLFVAASDAELKGLRKEIDGFDKDLLQAEKDRHPEKMEWQEALRKRRDAFLQRISAIEAAITTIHDKWGSEVKNATVKAADLSFDDEEDSTKGNLTNGIKDAERDFKRAEGECSELASRKERILLSAEKLLAIAPPPPPAPVEEKRKLTELEFSLRELDVPDMASAIRCVERLTKFAEKAEGLQKQEAEQLRDLIKNMFAAGHQVASAITGMADGEAKAKKHEANAALYMRPNAFGHIRDEAARQSRNEAAKARNGARKVYDKAAAALLESLKRSAEATRIYSDAGREEVAIALAGAIYAIMDKTVPDLELEVPVNREWVQEKKAARKEADD